MKSHNSCKRIWTHQAGKATALYLHVPFCLAKCRYCDFYSVPLRPAEAESYLLAAASELSLTAHELSDKCLTIFAGGGTPTAMGPDLLRRLLGMVQPWRSGQTEFSVEANPGALDEAVADVLLEAGVNRVNLGVQSLHDDELRLLGRIHDAAAAGAAVQLLQRRGFDNVGLDLIYAIPGQTLDAWMESVRAALGMGISHLSCYALSFEERTPLGEDLRAGRVAEADELLQQDMYYAAIDLAAGAGLEHYEISNFARPGRRCRHNLVYWRNQSYLGIGPGAASFVGGCRRTNVADLAAYTDAADHGRLPPAQQESITGRLSAAETLMLGLRLMEGVDRREFACRHGFDAVEGFPESFARHQQAGMVHVESSRIRLAREALFVADTVLADIVDEAGRPPGEASPA